MNVSKDKNTSPAIQQPVETPAPANMAQMLEELKAKEPLILAVLSERADQLAEERASRKQLEAFKADCEKTALERTQAKVDRLYSGDGPRWSVSIPEDRSQLHLSIPARSREEAIGKYQMVCGIRSTDHEYSTAQVA